MGQWPKVRRRLAGVLLALGVACGSVGGPAPVLAGEDFCEGDPVISINGQLVRIIVAMPVRSLPLISPANPVVLRVGVPKGASAQVIAYSGPITERVEFVAEDDSSGGDAMNVEYRVFAPDTGNATRYPIVHTAISVLETRVSQGSSGNWTGNSVKVPAPHR